MKDNHLIGLAWLLLAGIPQGAFTLPMKFVRRWKWEHLWLVYSVLAFFVLPLVFAVWTVPDLWEVYLRSSGRVLWMTALFGAGWGVGSVFFGLGVEALGMAVGFSMMTGLFTSLGTLVPLLILTPDLVWTRNGALIGFGNVVAIAGVVLFAVAGDLRDRQTAAGATVQSRSSFRTGLVICIAGGVLSAMFNFCYAFGKPIVDAAQSLGASSLGSVNALWLVALPSGGIINVGYCAFCIHRRRTWAALWRNSAPMDWIHCSSMALMWTGSVVVFTYGAELLGRLGPSLGWSFFNVVLLITTLVCGLLAREWQGVTGRAVHLLFAGLAVLLLSTCLLGLGGAGG